MDDLRALSGKFLAKGPAQAVQEVLGPAVNEMWQIQIYLTLKAYPTRFGKKADFKIPCICEYIFLTKKEAERFIPTFIDALVANGILTSEEAWTDEEKGVANTKLLDIQLKPLKVLSMEK